jgi:hypothetical protein
MATTGGNLATVAGLGGRYGLGTRLAAGAAILGCAATLALGGVRVGDTIRGRVPIVHAAPIVIPAGADDRRERLHFLEQNALPAAAATSTTTIAEQLLTLDRGLWPASGGAAPIGAERQRFLEWNTIFLPGAPTPATTEPADPRVIPR